MCCRERAHSLLFSGAKQQVDARSLADMCRRYYKNVSGVFIRHGSFVFPTIFTCEPPRARLHEQNTKALMGIYPDI